MSHVPGIGLSCTAFVLSVVSVSIPFWLYGTYNEYEVYQGLWKQCVLTHTEGTKTCSDMEDIPSWLKATRAMLIIGIVAIALGICMALIGMIKKLHAVIASYIVGFGGICCLIAVIIYGANMPPEPAATNILHMYAGFTLAMFAGILALVGGVFLKTFTKSAGYEKIPK